MASLNDEVIDQGLDWAITTGTQIDICNADPGLTYANIATYTVGNKASIVVGATGDGAVDGRQATTPAITDGSVTATDTATHWVLHNAVDTIVASGTLTASQAVTSGNNFTLDAIILNGRDPA